MKRRRFNLTLAIAGASALAATALPVGNADAREFVFGLQCDRSGPTQNVGNYSCDGTHDYFRLANRQGMFGPGNTVRVFEIDHGYNVPRGVEAYERTKEAGHVSFGIYGTPQTYALTPKLTADKVPGTSPGFGSAGAANGKSYPYIFPIAATYWSQMGAAVQYVLDKWKEGGNSGLPKIAYLFYDNPAGREPIEVLHDIRDQVGFELREFAVPPPGVDMRPQVLDIVRNYRADWVINHTFGKAPAVSVKELSRLRFPMDRVIGFVWTASEIDMQAAGWEAAEGYQALQFAGVGQDHKVIQDIRQMYIDEGKQPPEDKMAISVFYNRGVMGGALHARAIANAIEMVGADNVTSDDVRKGFESITNYSLDGFLPPITITEEDHEGGGFVQVWQVQGGKWVPASDWMQGFRDVIMKHVAMAEPPKQ